MPCEGGGEMSPPQGFSLVIPHRQGNKCRVGISLDEFYIRFDLPGMPKRSADVMVLVRMNDKMGQLRVWCEIHDHPLRTARDRILVRIIVPVSHPRFVLAKRKERLRGVDQNVARGIDDTSRLKLDLRSLAHRFYQIDFLEIDRTNQVVGVGMVKKSRSSFWNSIPKACHHECPTLACLRRVEEEA